MQLSAHAAPLKGENESRSHVARFSRNPCTSGSWSVASSNGKTSVFGSAIWRERNKVIDIQIW